MTHCGPPRPIGEVHALERHIVKYLHSRRIFDYHITMSNDHLIRFERLTQKQRECLQLVVQRRSSKQIARILGISKPAVDQRITNARNVLGAANRDEAAIMFAKLTSTYDSIAYDPVRVPKCEFLFQTFERDVGTSSGLTLDEVIEPYGFLAEQKSDWRFRLLDTLSSNGRLSKRVAFIVGLSISIMATVLIALSVAQSLTGLLSVS